MTTQTLSACKWCDVPRRLPDGQRNYPYCPHCDLPCVGVNGLSLGPNQCAACKRVENR